MSSKGAIPIWYFIGLLLLVYGVIILGAGIYQLSHPPDTVLSNLHATIWWGALMLVIGVVYVYIHRPGRRGNGNGEKE